MGRVKLSLSQCVPMAGAMTTTLAFLLALQTPAAQVLAPKIVTASIFKNGYAVITRTMNVGAPGTYTLESLPAGAMGTVWFRTSAGTTLESVKAVDQVSDYEAPLASLEEVLQANLKKDVRIEMKAGPTGDVIVLEGVLVSAAGEILVLDTAAGRRAVKKEGIREVSSKDGKLAFQVKRQSTKRVVQFLTSGKAGTISMLSLERGMSWSPAYAVDTTDKKELSLVAKATLINDLGDLNDAEAKLITGFPNIPYAAVLDPLLTGSGARLENMAQFGGGGFGGGGRGENRAMGMMTQTPGAVADFADAMPVPSGGGQQLEDLFFYKIPKVKLGMGQRSYQILLTMKSAYKDVYTWDIADFTVNNVEYRGIPEGPQDVWHALRFKNTSGQPLTTSVATTFDNGEIIGQDMLGYVPAGAETELKVNKSLDIRAEGSEAELERTRGAIKNRDGYPVYDLVTIEGTLLLTNMKPVTVETRIARQFTGELLKNPQTGVATKTAGGLTQMNPTTRLTWKPTLKSGERLKLTYVYQIYVRSTN